MSKFNFSACVIHDECPPMGILIGSSATPAVCKKLESAQAEIARLRGALEKIAEFQLRVFDSDADEIEATQNIVIEALSK